MQTGVKYYPLKSIGNSNLTMIGLSHQTVPLETRERFSIPDEKQPELMYLSNNRGIGSLICLSTCNRVEIYALWDEPKDLIRLLCGMTGNPEEEFLRYGFIKSGEEAAIHLFRVAAGLDSRIKGDIQITGQLSLSLRLAMRSGKPDAWLVRLVQSAIHHGRKIRKLQEVRTGQSSVARSAVKKVTGLFHNRYPSGRIYFSGGNKNHSRELAANAAPGQNPAFLIVGAGTVGREIAGLLLLRTGQDRITLINRNVDKAREMFSGFGIRVAGMTELDKEISRADIILVATRSTAAVINTTHFDNEMRRRKFIIDLGVPRNVDPAVGKLPGITLLDIDSLPANDHRKDNSRENSAEQMIRTAIDEHFRWSVRRAQVRDVMAGLHETMFSNDPDDPALSTRSRFVEGLAGKHFRQILKKSTAEIIP
jgi:glutamyl-tRNA reductase